MSSRVNPFLGSPVGRPAWAASVRTIAQPDELLARPVATHSRATAAGYRWELSHQPGTGAPSSVQRVRRRRRLSIGFVVRGAFGSAVPVVVTRRTWRIAGRASRSCQSAGELARRIAGVAELAAKPSAIVMVQLRRRRGLSQSSKPCGEVQVGTSSKWRERRAPCLLLRVVRAWYAVHVRVRSGAARCYCEARASEASGEHCRLGRYRACTVHRVRTGNWIAVQ